MLSTGGTIFVREFPVQRTAAIHLPIIHVDAALYFNSNILCFQGAVQFHARSFANML
jgi:hypothetical protein